jgi:hypothetical protein
LLVLDPGGPVTVLLPRPAVWALAQQQEWRPAVPGLGERRAVDPEVRDAVRSTLSGVPGLLHADRGPVVAVDAEPGRRAEVAVALTLVPGLDRAALDAVLRRVGDALATDETVTRRVDSLEMRLS